MSVMKCEIPTCSGLDRRQVDSAYFQDSYRTPLSNAFGRVYLFFIIPFHKWGVQRLIANAAAAGRL